MPYELTTEEVKRIVKDVVKYPLPPEKRERFLPTREQLPVIITFMRASEACETVKRTAEVRGLIIPKRSVCISEKFSEYHPETLEWARRNPDDFEELYRSIWWGSEE